MQSLQNLSSWSHATSGDVPKPLVGPSITLSPLGRPHAPTVFLFGGRMVYSRRMTADMYALDLDTMVWTKISAGEGRDNDLDPARPLGRTSPEARYFHSMDVWEDKLVLFGGMTDTNNLTVLSDVWFFDCVARRWLPQVSPRGGIGLGLEASGRPQQDAGLLPQARYAHLSSVSRGKLLVLGGQHVDNTYVYEINVFDLEQQVWVSKTPQAIVQDQNSKGAYRAIAVSSKLKAVQPDRGADLKGSALSYTVEEEGGGGDIVCYSNFEFANVRRELELLSPLDHGQTAIPSGPSAFRPPQGFSVQDLTSRMAGAALPPGLRFPTGGIVGSHLVLSGLYLASSAQSFSVWALNLETLDWKRLETHALASGSWNRAVIQPDAARLLVFGNKHASLAEDYGRRAINVDHVSVIALATFGIYQPPKLEVAPAVQAVGLTALEEKLISDFEVVCNDGRKVRCSREILRRRWLWFADEEKKVTAKAENALQAADSETSTSTHVMDTMTSFTPARLSPRQLHLPEPFPVCVAFVQFLYTLSLVTPLQLKAPVLSSLLFLAKQYKLERLAELVVHALHERLDRSIALGVYEIATLCGERELQVRALKLVVLAKSHARSASASSHTRGPSATAVPTPSPNQNGSAPNSSGSRSAASGSGSAGARAPRYTAVNPAMQMTLSDELDYEDAMTRQDSGTIPDLDRASPDTPTDWIDEEDDLALPMSTVRSMDSLQPAHEYDGLVRHIRSHDALQSADEAPRPRRRDVSPTMPYIKSEKALRRQCSVTDLAALPQLIIPTSTASTDSSPHLQPPSPTISDRPSTTASALPVTPSDHSFHRDEIPGFDYYYDSNRLTSPFDSPRRPPRDPSRPIPSPSPSHVGSPYPPPSFPRSYATDSPPDSQSYQPNMATFGSHRSSTASSENWNDRRSSDASMTKDSFLKQASPSMASLSSYNTFGNDFGELSLHSKGPLPVISDECDVVIGAETAKRTPADGWSQSDQTKTSETASIRTSSTSASSMNPKAVKNMAKLEKAEMKAAEQRQRQARMQQEARARMLEFQNKKNEAQLAKTLTASSVASSDKSSTKVKKTKKLAAMWKATIDAAAPTGGPM